MKILALNALASIQDKGRFGFRGLGVGTNGVMDPWALQAGNALMKNELDEPAIEFALGAMDIQFSQDTCFCLTGAIYEAYLDDTRVYGYWRINAKAGQTLKWVRPLQGMYAYLCVQGGFDIEPVLGSASTNTKAEFGGKDGRFLQQDDEITLKTTPHTPLPVIGVARLFSDNDADAHNVIRIVKNSEYDCFDDASKMRLVQQNWKVDTSSNRMGYRCVGDVALKPIEDISMGSHGVAAGMIQVPPQGQPIVLMADAQTTGGYPKIATVIEADIGLMAQTRFGQHCRFELISMEDALEARQQRQHYIERIRRYANDN